MRDYKLQTYLAMRLLEKYLQKEIKKLEQEWHTLDTDAEKMENKNLRQEMIDTIAFYLIDKSDGGNVDTGNSKA